MADEKNLGGRPSIYTEELAQEVCERIATGESVRGLCEDDDMPVQKTIYLWLIKYPGFLQKYQAATESRAEVWLEDIIEIADEEPEFHHHVGWAKNRIDARKWAMSKLAAKRYGDKVMLAGADGASPAKLEVSWQPQEAPASPSTTGLERNSSHSTSEPNASLALSLTAALAKPSPASTTSSAPPLDVDWSDPDTPISPPTEDKPKP